MKSQIEAESPYWPTPPSNKLEQACYDEGMSFEEYIEWIAEQSI